MWLVTYYDDARIERVTKKQTHLHTVEKKKIVWRGVQSLPNCRQVKATFYYYIIISKYERAFSLLKK